MVYQSFPHQGGQDFIHKKLFEVKTYFFALVYAIERFDGLQIAHNTLWWTTYNNGESIGSPHFYIF